MKKYILTLLIIGFVLISCKSHRFSDTYWIAVQSSPIQPNSAYTIVDGLIFHFSENSIIGKNIFEETNRENPLKINNKQIIVNDTLLATVYAEYKDSIFLDIENYIRVKFVKLDKAHAIKEKQDFSKHKDWSLSYNDYVRELYLTDTVFSDWSNARICLQKNVTDNRMINTFDKWNVLNINGNQLFVKTYNQFDYELYRVKKYTNDSIIALESLKNPQDSIVLKKRPYLSDNELNKIVSKIQNTTWKTKKIVQLDTVSESFRGWEEKTIRYKSLIDKKISYEFSKNNVFQLFESDTLASKGTWNLSPTGKEIILNNGIRPEDYIDLIQVQSDSITIGHLQEFRALDEYAGLNIQKMYYVIELVKQ